LREPRAVKLAAAALVDPQTQVPALGLLAELGGPEHAYAAIELARGDPTIDLLRPAVRLLSRCSQDVDVPADRRAELQRAIDELQGQSGLLARWLVNDSVDEEAAARARDAALSSPPAFDRRAEDRSGWRLRFSSGPDGRVNVAEAPHAALAAAIDPKGAAATWIAVSQFNATEAATVQFLGSAAGKFEVWLNGRRLFGRDQPRPYQSDSDRFEGTLDAGMNRVVVQGTSAPDQAAFQLRFRRKSSSAEIERFVQAALAQAGDAERGRKVFFDEARAQCSRCHRIGETGERIGPELTGVGERFSRIHIVESILEPSRTVAPGFQSVSILLKDGRVLSGVKVSDTADTLTLADNQAKKHTIATSEIDEQRAQSQSTMPEGLAKQLTVEQFVDLVAFLTAQRLNR
jgi:putative heme-binding domain-containing protein